MSHPKDRYERFLISKKLGEKRSKGYWVGSPKIQRDQEFMERAAYMRRNTTVMCSCAMCGNPRRKSWKDKLTMQELKFEEKCQNEFL